MRSQSVTNSFASLSPRHSLDPFVTKHISSKRSNSKMAFFRCTNQENINFVRDLSLSQQHTLASSGNRCLAPCFATDINGRLNEKILQVKPQIKS